MNEKIDRQLRCLGCFFTVALRGHIPMVLSYGSEYTTVRRFGWFGDQLGSRLVRVERCVTVPTSSLIETGVVGSQPLLPHPHSSPSALMVSGHVRLSRKEPKVQIRQRRHHRMQRLRNGML